jgi:hypothetical protein
MYKCSHNDDCRSDESYECYAAKTFGVPEGEVAEKGMEEAEVLGSTSKFCAQIPLETATEPPSNMMTVPTGQQDAGLSN